MLADVQEEYFDTVDRDYDKTGTSRALKRGILKFTTLIGNRPMEEVALRQPIALWISS